MFYWGIMGGGLLDSVGLIIKIQDVAVKIMSSIGWANNSQEKICAGSFFSEQTIILEVEENICHKAIPINLPTPI